MNEILWAAAHWSQKISGAASAASGTRCYVCATHACVHRPHAAGSQRLCALDVLVAACHAIRGGPSASPVAEPLLPETRAAAAGVTTWRSRKLKVVNSLPKSNRFGVIGERQPRALAAAVELTALQAAASSTRCSTEQAKATRWCSRSACSMTTRWFWASGWRQWAKFCCKKRRPRSLRARLL